MREDDLTKAMDEAQQPARGYGPFAGMQPIGAASPAAARAKTQDQVTFFCEVYMIHCPPGSCPKCRGGREEDEEEGAPPTSLIVYGRGVVGHDEPAYVRCPHNERAAYLARVNEIHALKHTLIARQTETLKNGSIQVRVEWLETKKKAGE